MDAHVSTMPPGEVIKLLRRAYGSSQHDLAHALGITRPYLSEVENGREPGMELLRAASMHFNLPVALFLAGESSDDESPVSRALRGVLEKVLEAKKIERAASG